MMNEIEISKTLVLRNVSAMLSTPPVAKDAWLFTYTHVCKRGEQKLDGHSQTHTHTHTIPNSSPKWWVGEPAG